ncbi:MAG: acyl--CoA ligase [Clostridia bacterium]|nr:acyl--CoA ligase [Clostridia bacterium]
MSRFEKYTDAETFAKIVDYPNVTEMWRHSVETWPDVPAIMDNGKTYTYAALDADVAAFRAVLKNNGVAPGSLVGILCPNSYEFVKAYLACATYGVPSVLMPAHLDEKTVYGMSMMFGMKAVIYHEALTEKVAIIKQTGSTTLIAAETTADEAVPAIPVPSDVLCTILFTGGTTGKSKGAKLSHRAVMAGTKNGCYGIKSVFADRYLLVLPLTHVFGLIRNLMTSLYTGSTLYICRNNKDMFRDVAIFKPTIMILVPALAEMALGLSRQFGRNMWGEDLKTIICGAAPVPPYLIREYDKLGITLLPGYGLTESANLVSGNPEALRKPESVGLIYEGMEYKLVDGELWLKGVNMMDGYVGGENETAYEDGWFKTGDLARIDEEGYPYITGRTKEIIVLQSGENVSPAELEVMFYGIDAVQDCVVYDRTENGAQFLVLEVLPRMSVVKEKAIADVESYVREEVAKINATLPSFEKINKVVFRDTDFPRTPAMKIDRKKASNPQ